MATRSQWPPGCWRWRRVAFTCTASVEDSGYVTCGQRGIENLYFVNEAFERVTAIDRLSDYLNRVPASNVAAIDWGIVDSLRLLNRGSLKLAAGNDPISKRELSAADREMFDATQK